MRKGEKIIDIGGLIVVTSLSFTWISTPYENISGFSSEGMFLLAAIAYPVLNSYYLINSVNKFWGFLSVGGGAVFVLIVLIRTISEPGTSPASGLLIAASGLAIIAWGIIKDNEAHDTLSSE
ncbi:hypothetical protein [Alkalicoccus halolimnae]|uniref:Uncharacterized protein n=1 Tax=Alkalicoccus halolimnae TaxID=1667239 RepID=A0A5C7FK23_9BACI|nr:hypothetical protein [Alkalicoccus halolimnae]TXF85756.1 hypothetical protein FTX54_06675 [Alkalicoccus halolimnae]